MAGMAERTQHARPPHTERHVRRAGAWLTRARFGPLALVMAGLLGLGGGAATSVALGRSAQLPQVGAALLTADPDRSGSAPSTSPSTTTTTPARRPGRSSTRWPHRCPPRRYRPRRCPTCPRRT